jgi:hypothetical protein
MRKTLGVSLLVLLLTGTTGAGVIPNMPPTPPPSSAQTSAAQEPTATAQETTTDGEMPNPAPDTLTQTVLDLLAVLPSLF